MLSLNQLAVHSDARFKIGDPLSALCGLIERSQLKDLQPEKFFPRPIAVKPISAARIADRAQCDGDRCGNIRAHRKRTAKARCRTCRGADPASNPGDSFGRTVRRLKIIHIVAELNQRGHADCAIQPFQNRFHQTIRNDACHRFSKRMRQPLDTATER